MNNLDFNFFCTGCTRSREYREAHCFTKYRIRRYNKGEYITTKGERVRELSIVLEGAINVSFLLDSGHIIRSVNHSAPVPIGGVAILSRDNRYLVDTQATEPCTTINVRREDIIEQTKLCETLLMNLFDYSSSRVDVLSNHLSILSQRSIKAKVAYYILICSKSGKYHFDRSIKELAEHLCVERPSLSRALSQLVTEGVITHNRGKGEILDTPALEAMVS